MRKLIIIALILLFPFSVLALDNRAIRESGLPSGITIGAATTSPYDNLSTYLSQTGIAFVNSDPDTITDSSSGFVSAGFVDGDSIQIDGSANNDGLYLITTVTAGTITLSSTASLANESAGATVNIREKPTFFIVNTLTYNTSVSDTTRSGVPMKTGGFYDWIEFSQKGNAIGMSEITGVSDASDHVYTEYSGDNIAFYGQTAPTTDEGVAGLFIKEFCLDIRGSDSVLQHISISAQYCVANEDNVDAMNITGADNDNHVENVLVDHVALFHAVDEIMQIRWADDSILSNSILAWGLADAGHSKGEHSKGLLVGGTGADDSVLNLLVYGNLFAHNKDRNPVIQWDSYVAVVNNFIHHSGSPTLYGQGSYQVAIDSNVIQGRDTIFDFWLDPTETNEVWLYNNKCDAGSQSRDQAGEDDWSLVGDYAPSYSLADLETNFKTADPPTNTEYGFTSTTVEDVDDLVFSYVGPFPLARNSISSKAVSEAKFNTGDYRDDAEYPTITETSRLLDTGMVAEGIDAFPGDPHGGGDRNNFYVWLDTITIAVETPYTPPSRNNDPSLDTNAKAWWLGETGANVFSDELTNSEDLTGSESGGVVTDYLDGTDSKWIGTGNWSRYVGAIAAIDYTNIDEVTFELGTGDGDITSRTCYVGKAPVTGDSPTQALTYGSLTAWENQACAVGNNTFTIDPAQSVTAGEAILIYFDDNSLDDFPVLKYHAAESIHSDLGTVYIWTTAGAKDWSDASAEINLQISTSGAAMGTETNSPLEGVSSWKFASADSSFLSRADALLDNSFPGKNGQGNETFTMGMIFNAASLPSSTAHTYLVAKDDAYALSLYTDATDSDNTKLYLALDDGDGNLDRTYMHDTALSDGITYGVVAGWTNADNTAFIRLFKLTDGTWAVEGTAVESDSSDFDLGEGATPFEVGALAGASTFDGTIDDLAIFIDELTADEALAWAGGTYSSPSLTIDSVTVGDASYNDLGATFPCTLGLSEEGVAEGTSLEFNGGTVDITCSYSTGNFTDTHIYICGPLTYGNEIEPITLKSVSLSGTLEDLGGNAATMTLPTLTGTVNIKSITDPTIRTLGVSIQ
jgi:hypothetical protein